MPRKATSASVDIQELAPAGIDPSEFFIAENEGRQERTVEQTQNTEGETVVTTHERPGTVVMYKPSETQGYIPRRVSVSAMRLLIRQGWTQHCPDCKKDHLDKKGQHSTDPNLCDARNPVAVRICPVCQKRIYDNMGFVDTNTGQETDDLNVIRESGYDNSTGASRTKTQLDLHLWVHHPRQAQVMNVPPLPAALRDMVEEARPV